MRMRRWVETRTLWGWGSVERSDQRNEQVKKKKEGEEEEKEAIREDGRFGFLGGGGGGSEGKWERKGNGWGEDEKLIRRATGTQGTARDNSQRWIRAGRGCSRSP